MTDSGLSHPGYPKGRRFPPRPSAQRSRDPLIAAAAALIAAATGCTGPTFSTDTYLDQALQTTVGMLSAVSTGVMVTELAEGGKAFPPYLDVSATDAEESARSITDTFGTRQPPTPDSDGLRETLIGLNGAAVDDLSALRIALRRDDVSGVGDAGESLRETAAGLVEIREGLQ